jgi:hypothetical protein
MSANLEYLGGLVCVFFFFAFFLLTKATNKGLSSSLLILQLDEVDDMLKKLFEDCISACYAHAPL